MRFEAKKQSMAWMEQIVKITQHNVLWLEDKMASSNQEMERTTKLAIG